MSRCKCMNQLQKSEKFKQQKSSFFLQENTMKGIHSLAGLLLLIIVQGSWHIPLQETGDTSRMTEEEPTDESRELINVKRHSQGMFTNDYSKYLEEKAAQDFVEWLKHSKSKRSGMTEELSDEPGELTNVKRHSQGMFTNDYSKYLEEKRAKEFVEWLKNGESKRSGRP
ncbi:glucagon-2-like [Huso huso]|uniref:Glucagon-2-like n=1 Tax=Huso huso TaxID=61971 RepID=A0ABR0ZE43_HUSHU